MSKFLNEWKKDTKAGEISSEHLDKDVVLMGWVNATRDHGKAIFMDLRDRFGVVQVVFGGGDGTGGGSASMWECARSLRQEFVVAVRGKVRKRAGAPNKNLATGEYEVIADELEIFNRAKPIPFQIDDEVDANETTRLKYRYIDLRRPPLQKAMILRSKAMEIVRNHFYDEDFLEMETPILTKSTPEGARDYLVPSRIQPGAFYALPQSPQIFKQLFQIAGYERYFQICRCFRDEDLRADRQPEFTQIDVEMSFVSPEDIMSIIDPMIKKLFSKLLNYDVSLPVKQMTYDEAIKNYGVDNPDVRFGMEIIDFTKSGKDSEFQVFKNVCEADGKVLAVIAKDAASVFSRKKIDGLTEFVKEYGAKGLAWLKYQEEGIKGPVAKFLKGDFTNSLVEDHGFSQNDIVFFLADADSLTAQTSIGRLRGHLGRELGLINPDSHGFIWVTDFPMFEKDSKTGKLAAMHHPFTSPAARDIHLLPTEPQKVKAKAYDLVIDGQEVGGGSIRISDSEIQYMVFKALNLKGSEIEEKFGFLLEALSYGAPPHGGIAFGFDRLVAILAGVSSIRDVIAFPKTTRASCLMTGAPGGVSADQLEELSLKKK